MQTDTSDFSFLSVSCELRTREHMTDPNQNRRVANVMRKRGIFFLVAGGLAWACTVLAFKQIRSSPFGYEFGSVAFPVPLYLRLIGVFGFVSTLGGAFLTILDLTRWFKAR